MDWFLYNRDLRHERVKRITKKINNKKLFSKNYAYKINEKSVKREATYYRTILQSISFKSHFQYPLSIKGCVRYIFASLFCMSKREYLWNKENCFLSNFESSFHSWDNQVLTFQIFKCHDVIKCLSMKHETHTIE